MNTLKGNEITAIRFKCDGCEGEFLECDVATTGGSEVYCEECFKEKQDEAGEDKPSFPRGVVLYCENGFGSMFPLRR
jgi:hypothetical protein